MSSASIPPMHEEDQRRARRTGSPIFLWSTVVNQLQKPVVAFGRRRTSSARRVAASGLRGRRHRRAPCVITSAPAGSRRSSRPRRCVITGCPCGVSLVNDGMPTHDAPAGGSRQSFDSIGIMRRRVEDPVDEVRRASARSTPLANVVRLARWVRFGPYTLVRRVVEDVAVRALELRREQRRSASPASASGTRRPLAAGRRPTAAKSSGDLGDHPEPHVRRARARSTPRTARGRCRARRPRASCVLSRPGTTSACPSSSGTQKLWITLQFAGSAWCRRTVEP